MEIFDKIERFLLIAKYAAGPEFWKLKERGGENWFGEETSTSNADQYFALYDRKILKLLKNLNDNYYFIDEQTLQEYYFNHPKTQELIKFIVLSFVKHFPKLDGRAVYNYLMDGDELQNTQFPIFTIIHDLIHKVLQPNFEKALEAQRDKDDLGIHNSLLDELNEDIASSMSSFEPQNVNLGQGIIHYLENIFESYIKSDNKQDMVAALEKTFHHAKAELRGKIDKINSKHVSKTDISGPVKQLVDGILSKLKMRMISQAKGMQYGYKVFSKFYVGDILSEYYDKIKESPLVKQEDSSRLRMWMQECLKEMGKLYNYFENEFPKEFEFNDEDGESPPSSY